MNLYELKVEVDSTYEEMEELEVDPKDIKICLQISEGAFSDKIVYGTKDIVVDHKRFHCFIHARDGFVE